MKPSTVCTALLCALPLLLLLGGLLALRGLWLWAVSCLSAVILDVLLLSGTPDLPQPPAQPTMKHPIAGISHYRARPHLPLTLLEALGVCILSAASALLVLLVVSVLS